MKCIFLVISLFCIAHSSQAQLLMGLLFAGRNKLDSDVVKMGIQVGGNFSNLSHLDEGKTQLGLLLGFYTEIKLNDHLVLNTGAFPLSKMGMRDLPLYPLEDEMLNQLLSEAQLKRNLSYLGMPFLLNYQINESWRAGLGPQLQLLLNAKDDFYQSEAADELLYRHDISEDVRKIDYGISMHAGYYLKHGEGLYLQLRYYLGIRDVMKNIADTQANQSLQMILGIPIKSTQDKEKAAEN